MYRPQRAIALLFVVAVSFGFAHQARSQTPAAPFEPSLYAKWLDELSKEVGSPPEHGSVPLEASKAASGAAALSKGVTTPPTLNRYLSLLVTDVDTVSKFSFAKVMEQIASASGDQSLSKETLFHQWWDTANKGPGLLLGPHCNDIPAADQPYECPRPEGQQALSGPLNTDASNVVHDVFAEESLPFPRNLDGYSAIAVSNRYDLRSPPLNAGKGLVTYPDCGEYRLIFALNAGKTIPASLSSDNTTHPGNILNRNLISFEFRLKNPSAATPQKPGVPQGCLPILQFWSGLSAAMPAAARGDLLLDFFMNGEMKTPDKKVIGKLPWPVVDGWNLSFGLGQIRTNQFMNTVTNTPAVPPTDYTKGVPAETTITPFDWILREFRTLITNSDHKMLIVPVSTKTNPRYDLWTSVDATANSGGPIDPNRAALLQQIRRQTAALLGEKTSNQFPNLKDINSISFNILKDNTVNAFESDEGAPIPCPPGPGNNSPCRNSADGKGNILDAFGTEKTNHVLSTNIQADLDDAGVTPSMSVTPINLVDRIRSQTCAGCHQFSDTKKGNFGFDTVGLGGGAVWPTKACGDFEPSCTIPQDPKHPADAFLLTDPKKLHPPMQFTQVSEAILVPSADGKSWRYAISSTVECMLDYREKVMEQALKLPVNTASHCP
ncbi:MAG TPA: hypothetical protein VF583_12645 [Bradyrhizobium sp.]